MAEKQALVIFFGDREVMTDLYFSRMLLWPSRPNRLSSKAHAYSTCHPADPAWKHERRSPSNPMEGPTSTSDLMQKNGYAKGLPRTVHQRGG
jgi:hypothetical protein